jgi:hypothetical protein
MCVCVCVDVCVIHSFAVICVLKRTPNIAWKMYSDNCLNTCVERRVVATSFFESIIIANDLD